MAKKNKKDASLPEGMSRRQAKLAARAKKRAEQERDPRPFGGLAAEAQLVALQEFAPSAIAKLDVKGFDEPVTLCTVLPGAVAALVREEHGTITRFVALQVKSHSHNPNRDLAYALTWVGEAKPGETLESTIADGSQPAIGDLIDAETTIEPEAHQDFNWWLPEDADARLQYNRGLQQANDSIMPSYPVGKGLNGALWWVDAGTKAHIRWVRTEEETKVLDALARIAARGELNLGEDTKFAGVFRTHGIVVPVFDLDPTKPHDDYEAELEDLDEKITKELDNTDQLTADEHRQLANIKSRQVTIR